MVWLMVHRKVYGLMLKMLYIFVCFSFVLLLSHTTLYKLYFNLYTQKIRGPGISIDDQAHLET